VTPATATRWPPAQWRPGDILAHAASKLLLGIAGALTWWSDMLLVSRSGLVVVLGRGPAVKLVLIDATIPFGHWIDGSIGDTEMPVTRLMREPWVGKERRAHRGAAGEMVRESSWTGRKAGMLATTCGEGGHRLRLEVPRGRTHGRDLLMVRLVAFGAWLGGSSVMLARAARRVASVSASLAPKLLRCSPTHLVPDGRGLEPSRRARV
jgi:hypothetical protein